jgi:hypothetical protein
VVDPNVIPTTLPRSERDILVHGTAAQIEFENAAPPNTMLYRGWGAVAVGESQHAWIHVPVPVAIDVPGVLPIGEGTPFEDLGRLVRLEVHYDSSSGQVGVRNLHLWDGDDRFFYWDYPDPHPSGLQIGASELHWHGSRGLEESLGISIGVMFPTAFDSPEPPTSFTLFSARAHLE